MSVVSTPQTVIPTGTWAIDPSHSSLEFGVKHLGIATVKGRAGGFTGTITGGPAPSVEGTVDARRITTWDEGRDGHLQSPEFFDTARHPELRFTSTSVEQADDELVVHGELTIKGITRPVTLYGELAGPSVDPWENERIGLTLQGVIDRTDFDLRWNAPLPGGGFVLADEVALAASFSAIRQG
jgi:polyisoprenoid-binding protein YceI